MTNRYMVCTDLDRTMLPNGSQPESPAAEGYFSSLVSRREITLVYVSGRHRELVEQAIRQYRIPLPDFVIGDVGTTIYRVGTQRVWQPDGSWQSDIAADWHELTANGLLEKLAVVPALREQEAEKQNRFKLSFYLDAGENQEALDAQISEVLTRAGVAARLVWSIDDLTGEGLLDVLPERASKRHAIEFLMRQNGFATSESIFCGDSGNDLEVLISPIPAVLVANAHEGVRQRAEEGSRAQSLEHVLYIARGGFLGMNGNYRGGMLEGIVHFYPELETWLHTGNERGQ